MGTSLRAAREARASSNAYIHFIQAQFGFRLGGRCFQLFDASTQISRDRLCCLVTGGDSSYDE